MNENSLTQLVIDECGSKGRRWQIQVGKEAGQWCIWRDLQR